MLSRKTNIPFETLNIEDEGSHLIVHAFINGKNAILLIDTGASRTVFDQEKILQFVENTSFEKNDKLSTGLGTNSMQTSMVLLKSLQIGSLTLEKFNGVLLDLQHVIGTYEKLGYKAIDGVLGNDILVRYKAIINFEKQILTLSLK